MFKIFFLKLEELIINIGIRSKLLYNYLLQTPGMIIVNHYVNKYLHQPIHIWFKKKKTKLYNKT